jgi:lipoprotein NlpD
MQASPPEEPRQFRQFGTAIITSLVSVALVIGGLSLALSENAALRPTPTGIVSVNDMTLTSIASGPGTSTDAGFIIPSPTATGSGSTPLAPFTPTNAATASTMPTLSGNCGPPAGWVKTYVVQPGDTLFRISLNYSTTTAALQHANCKGSSTNIRSGELLWVPNVQPRTPGVTSIPNFPTSTPQPTEPLTETALPFTASPSATNSQVPATQTPLPTVTPVTPPP